MHTLIRSLLSVLLICGCSLSFADSVKDAAREMSGLASGATDTINNTAPDQFAPRYEGIPASSDGFYGGGNIIPKAQGTGKINDCQNIPEEDLYKRQECEGINFVGKNKQIRPDVTVSTEEALAQGTNKIASDPTETLNKWGWTIPFNPDGSIGTIPTEACNTELITIPAKTTLKDCSVYQGIEQFLCETSLKVEVDPSFNYSCLETKYQSNTYNCDKKLNVTCETALTCANQGVVPGGTQGDMRVTYNHVGGGYFDMFFGNPGNDYWGAGFYERTLTLNIKNHHQLTAFYLLRTEFDDHMLLKVNGRTVFFNGTPYAYAPYYPRNWHMGSAVAINKRAYCGDRIINGYNVCVKDLDTNGFVADAGRLERSTSWDYWPGHNLLPFLREGYNEFRLYVAVGGRGEIFLNFRTQQACNPKCIDTWQNNCTEYEGRVKP